MHAQVLRPMLGLLALFLITGLKAQDCDPNGNIVIFSNYDGGVLIIDINQDIPDLKVGICSYEPVTVEFTGNFVDNVSEVVYAGYQPNTGTGNFHCSNSPAVTTVENPPNATVQILNLPPVTLLSPDVPIFPGSTIMVSAGNNNNITSCSGCENDTYQGGSNTAEQIIDFFATEFNSNVRFLKTQYGCWCGTQNLDPPVECCEELSSVTAVTIDASPNNTICNGSTVTLDAGSGYSTYAWSTGENTQTIELDGPGSYSVTVTNDCGIASNSIIIEAGVTPELDITTTPDYICIGGSIEVNVINSSQVPGPYTFTLTDADGNEWTSTDGQFSDLPSGTYTLTGSSQAVECITSTIVNIGTDAPFFVTNFSVTNANCLGAADGEISFDFTEILSDNYMYFITNNGISVTNGMINSSMVEIVIPFPGVFTVEVLGLNSGCNYEMDFVIEEEGLGLNTSIVNDASCHGETSGSISVEIVGGEPPYAYNWFNDAGDLIGELPDLIGISAGLYELLIVDDEGCEEIYNFEVFEPTLLEIETDSVAVTCSDSNDGSVSIVASGGTGPYSYSLDGLNFQLLNNFDNLSAGSYFPQIEDANGCFLTAPVVVLNAPPSLTVDLSSSEDDLVIGESFSLFANISGSDPDELSFVWTPADGLSCTDCPDPVTIAGVYDSYALTVTNAVGCTATDSIQLFIDRPTDIYLPNIFTPGSNSPNNRYLIFPGPGIQQVLQFKIFNRWGALVFDQSESVDPGWNGIFRGKPAPSGVYTALVEVEFFDGSRELLTTSITLLR